MKAPRFFGGRHLPLIATTLIFLVLFGVAAFRYDGFFSGRTVVNLLIDNAALGIVAVGMTLVIFSGGIDLSVGAVIGFTSILTATLLSSHGWHPALVWSLALGAGAALGATMGVFIQIFARPPFLITLAGMFFARGAGFWITTENVSITHPWYDAITAFELPISETMRLTVPALMLLGVLAVGYVLAHHTRFGRNLLAIGGNEQSAVLMGLPVRQTQIAVYALNGACAALAGIVSTFSATAGDASRAKGVELDAIAAVVIGGTLLSGGRGHMGGTLLGVLILGTIQAAILFDGRLDPAWMRIVVGALLLVFILLQRVLVRGGKK